MIYCSVAFDYFSIIEGIGNLWPLGPLNIVVDPAIGTQMALVLQVGSWTFEREGAVVEDGEKVVVCLFGADEISPK